LFDFSLDLACTRGNCLAPHGLYDEEVDSLGVCWVETAIGLGVAPVGFLNPPYSRIDPWIEKAVQEAREGFTTVALLPCPNGEARSRLLLEHAHVTWIIGRLAFHHAITGAADRGNTGGSIIAVFGPMSGYQRHRLPVCIGRGVFD
jgi:phage N-6-adenine-methyltransferase